MKRFIWWHGLAWLTFNAFALAGSVSLIDAVVKQRWVLAGGIVALIGAWLWWADYCRDVYDARRVERGDRVCHVCGHVPDCAVHDLYEL